MTVHNAVAVEVVVASRYPDVVSAIFVCTARERTEKITIRYAFLYAKHVSILQLKSLGWSTRVCTLYVPPTHSFAAATAAAHQSTIFRRHIHIFVGHAID